VCWVSSDTGATTDGTTSSVASTVNRCILLLQAGIEKLSGLEVLYMSNNKVRDWAEIDKLATLENLKVQYAAVMLHATGPNCSSRCVSRIQPKHVRSYLRRAWLQELLLLNNPCQVEFVKAAPEKNTAMAEYRMQVNSSR
jgi:hypothetical protein